MNDVQPNYPFFGELARILNAGQARSVLLHGNVHDLFFVKDVGTPGDWVPLIDFLSKKCAVPGIILLVYELHGPLQVQAEGDRAKLKNAWVAWKAGLDLERLIVQGLADRGRQREREALEHEFETNWRDAVGKPTVALEFLRQLTLCSRSTSPGGKPFLSEDLLVLIEAADMLLPAGDGDVSRLAPVDRHRVGIVQAWFSDPAFTNGKDSVVLLAESRSLVHPRVARLPQLLAVEVPPPDVAVREQYIGWFQNAWPSPQLWAGAAELARFTAGLSVHALRQLLLGAAHAGKPLTPGDVIGKVQDFIQGQLGEDVVEFKKPTHSLDHVIGFTRLKAFIRDEFLPRIRASGPEALSGAAVAGPIGGGKTFIFEAAAAALDLPVLVLKSIRSQWFGQTDVILERLRRVLEALVKVVIVVDEADTQFGGVGQDTHETERRLTGKIQQMMSDPALRGKVIWLLMTARINLLSPDIRRPGRVGDLIIPVLDPEGADRVEFLKWVLKAARAEPPTDDDLKRLDGLTQGYSAAAFASLRSHLKAKAAAGPLTLDTVEAIVRDHLPPAIEQTRRYQTLQALVNCTRRSLLPDPNVTEGDRAAWQMEIRKLEVMGIR
jgi:hypothetical protein